MNLSNRTSSTGRLAPEKSDTAILILDLLSDFTFPDGAKVYRAALPVARRIAALKRRARKSRVPVVYVNDNFGRWRSDFAAVVKHCADSGPRGAAMVKLLGPAQDDYCILKPRHSGFFATALDSLLEYIGATRLVITGASSNQCVLFTANDAYVREYKLRIPRDCIAAPSSRETRFALEYFTSALGADIRPSTSMRFHANQAPVSR